MSERQLERSYPHGQQQQNMNRHYDIEEAKRLLMLEQDVSAKVQSLPGTLMNDLELGDTAIRSLRYPSSYRLTGRGDEEGDAPEGILLRLQGILCGKLLPPVEPSMVPRSLSQLRALRQHVKVTGLGNASFDQTAVTLERIHSEFQEHLPENVVDPFQFTPYEGYQCIESHARYFTDRALVPYESNNSFLPYVDPRETLARAQPDSFIHALDNQVEYCSVSLDDKGSRRYRACSPASVRIGDIVEIAFICSAIPIKGARFKLILQLRAVTVLSSAARTASELLLRSPQVSDAVLKPKRRSIYLDDAEVEGARKRMKSLTLDDFM
ncbi:hypothetical protein BKA70DRAFT_1447514 [Coprinopsis sp. MPI-PUGE-AT-0042]|nr:hypothetical protein BKA70DRAFT_1447514 [Coprinopsis sp. MPI-PUGE-AT-0042]